MDKLTASLALLLIVSLTASMFIGTAAAADSNKDAKNDSNATNKTEEGLKLPDLPDLPDVNLTDAGEKLGNATKTGIEPVDSVTKFLTDASPFLLIIAGVAVILLAGFGRIIGIILIIIALIRLIQIFFF